MTGKRLTPDELADRLDATLPPNQDTIPVAGDDPLVNLALQLARAPRPEMSPETMARIRAQVLNAHQPQIVRRPTLRLHTTPIMRWAAVFVIVVFFFGSAMIPASANSLPGELLYPVKLGVEQIEVITAPSPAALSVVYLNHAERRLNEAQLLLERGQFESALLLQGWESLAHSMEIAEQTSDQQRRAGQIDIALNAVLQQAEQQDIVSADEIREITGNLPTIDDNADSSLAAPTATPTSSPQPVASPTAMPTSTPDSTLTEEPTSRPVETSTDVPTSTPVNSAIAASLLIEVDTPYTATIVAIRGVNVRSGPGTNFDIIAVVQPGSLVEVIGHNDDESWLYVRLNDGRVGWIAAYLLRAGIVPNSAGDQTNTGDFGCEHPGNYCNAPGYNNDNGQNGGNGQGQGNANGNANGGGPPASGSGPPRDSGGSSGHGNPPHR